MENTNDTTGINFILSGLLNYTQTHLFFFSVVLMTFLTSLMSNIFMIMVIHVDSRLCTPMYFLLSQLSIMDVMLVLTVVPKMVGNYLMHIRSISPAGCGAQIFLFVTLEGGECFLLAAMAYDRYAAICHPLRYPVLMNQKLCLHMTAGSWLLGGVDGLMQAGVTLSFPYGHSREVNHFFCKAPSLVRLACTDTVLFEFFMYVCCVLMLLISVSFILASYGLILITVLRMHSAAARKKAFATCSSHLAVVGFFSSTIIFIYMRPKSYRSVAHDKVVSAFYTIFTPVLNPLIYSVRNKEVQGALESGWRSIFNDFYSGHYWHNGIIQI